MEEILIQNAQTFASQHQLQLAERLGFGIHGIILVTEDKSKAGKTALKVHRSVEPYLREREVYERLRDAGLSQILGFNVPQLIRFDDELRIIEMSIVTRPFVLDFAGAWLDTPPDFPDETWAEWEAEKREQFGTLWPRVQAVLETLEALDIHMVDGIRIRVPHTNRFPHDEREKLQFEDSRISADGFAGALLEIGTPVHVLDPKPVSRIVGTKPGRFVVLSSVGIDILDVPKR